MAFFCERILRTIIFNYKILVAKKRSNIAIKYINFHSFHSKSKTQVNAPTRRLRVYSPHTPPNELQCSAWHAQWREVSTIMTSTNHPRVVAGVPRRYGRLWKSWSSYTASTAVNQWIREYNNGWIWWNAVHDRFDKIVAKLFSSVPNRLMRRFSLWSWRLVENLKLYPFRHKASYQTSTSVCSDTATLSIVGNEVGYLVNWRYA